MRRDSRANRVAFRRAVWASALLHALAAGALLLFLRTSEKPRQPASGIDTHASDEPQVRITLSEEVPVSIEAPAPREVTKPQAVDPDTSPAPPVAQPEVASPSPQLPSKPFAPTVPRTLPAELLALLRKPAATPGGTASVEVPASDPNVRPAGGTPGASANVGRVPAMHGALAPGKTVVYVLDASGSMGADGKFDAARASLLATLRLQPATVRFQVIVYAGVAVPLLTSDASGLAATEANVRAAAEKLAALEPRGQSDHFGAIRTALRFRPDVILLLSDGDDISPALVKKILESTGQTVPIRLGRVTAEGVQRPPRELK